MTAGVGVVVSRLQDAGLTLPGPPEALGLYIPARRAGSLVFTAGQLPLRDGALITSGHVGAEVTIERARECAAQAALNALAAASTVCDLDRVAHVVKVTGFVSCAPGFTDQPAVLDGASEVMSLAFVDGGAHARAAVGVAELPRGAPVEVEVVLAAGD